MKRIAVISDVHFAGAAEQERRHHEGGAIANPLLRLAVSAYRHHVWLRDPFAHNGLLPEVCHRIREADGVVANGDYSCDSAFIGLADDPSFESASACLATLRSCFGDRLHLTMGDHELGKKSLFGGIGGLRLKSWERTTNDLAIQPVWSHRIGNYLLIGVTSTLWALPIFSTDALQEEMNSWEARRMEQVQSLEKCLKTLGEKDRWILFCHDPSALPFLAKNPVIASCLPRLESTIIGHLHSELILWKSRLLAGMPAISFMGNSIRRMSQALNSGKDWTQFRVTLCPSLAGLEIRKDGGYLWLDVDPAAEKPLKIHREYLPRLNS